MASSIFFLALALFAGTVAAKDVRIIGGNDVSIQNFPSVVQVENLNQGWFWFYHCGGSILNSIHVLSAAHCFTTSGISVDTIRIRAGTATKESGGVLVHISQIFSHPSYDGTTSNDGDIAVVRLASAFLFTSTLNIANIASAATVLPTGMQVTKVGWGVTQVNSPDRAQTLQAVNIPIVDHNSCVENYASLNSSPVVSSNMFCAGSSIADSCNGDNGSPVFFSNIVIGVVSWGHGCLIPGFPGVNTAVSSYTNWIVEVTSSA